MLLGASTVLVDPVGRHVVETSSASRSATTASASRRIICRACSTSFTRSIRPAHGRAAAAPVLGLAICKEIIEHHHGDIWVESTLNASAATFSFMLPIAAEHEASAGAAALPPLTAVGAGDQASRKKVLVVDDEPNIRELLKYELAAEGYTRCSEAASGEETIEIARREHPAIITLDILMPYASTGSTS